MLDAKNMWMAMGAFCLVAVGWRLMSPPPASDTTEPTAVMAVGYGQDQTYEKITRSQCVGTGDRIWVAHKDGFDCLTVIRPATLKAADGRSGDVAVVFIDGDVPSSEQTATGEQRMRETYARITQQMTDTYGVPFLVLSRPGVLGSSGVHLAGGRRDDTTAIDTALDELSRQHGFRRIVMAGQSGGARMIAQLLVLGRRDITCAVMGSGAYDVPRLMGGGRTSTNVFGDPGRRFLVPLRHAEDIAVMSNRRLFVVGDPKDEITPFPEQQAWAQRLAGLGHNVVLIEAEAKDEKRHGVSRVALAAAGLCAQGKPDADVVAAAGKRLDPNTPR